jgi:hypothetical protein
MSQKSVAPKSSSERIVKDIRRATRAFSPTPRALSVIAA